MAGVEVVGTMIVDITLQETLDLLLQGGEVPDGTTTDLHLEERLTLTFHLRAAGVMEIMEHVLRLLRRDQIPFLHAPAHLQGDVIEILTSPLDQEDNTILLLVPEHHPDGGAENGLLEGAVNLETGP